ncbi:MAG: nucleotidyltransferase domain-containing protein [Chloroflexota bacterium]
MPKARKSPTIDTSLDEVVDRLRSHPAVDGVLIVGSASRGELNPASDYDLVIVLSEMPIPLHVGVTNIDGRFTDVVFHTTTQLDEFLHTDEPLHFWHWTGRLVGWLEEGQIVFDRRGCLQKAQKKAKEGDWLARTGTASGMKAWSGVNYNLLVLRRYLSSDDPLYLETADLRMMIYGPSDLFFNYFETRRLRWDGEKAAIKYLQKHDPDYLSMFKQFLTENERHAKFRLYEVLAERTIAPVGRLWQTTDTIMMLDGDESTSKMEQKALNFWEELIQERETNENN